MLGVCTQQSMSNNLQFGSDHYILQILKKKNKLKNNYWCPSPSSPPPSSTTTPIYIYQNTYNK